VLPQAKLQSNIDQYKQQKRDIIAEIVEVERQIMLWERKIQLEKEMQVTSASCPVLNLTLFHLLHWSWSNRSNWHLLACRAIPVVVCSFDRLYRSCPGGKFLRRSIVLTAFVHLHQPRVCGGSEFCWYEQAADNHLNLSAPVEKGVVYKLYSTVPCKAKAGEFMLVTRNIMVCRTCWTPQ
jgi:hypothetical protein